MGPITVQEREKLIGLSPVAGQYDETVDRESAYEILEKRAAEAASAKEEDDRRAREEDAPRDTGWTLPDFGNSRGETRTKAPPRRTSSGRSGYQRQTVTETAIKSIVRTVSTTLGREIVRGILGSLRKR